MTDRMRGVLNDLLVVVLKSLAERDGALLGKTQINNLERGFEEYLGKIVPGLVEEPKPAVEEPRKVGGR